MAPVVPPLLEYEVTAIANLHAQMTGVQNIWPLISVILDPTSTHYALTLQCYALDNNVFTDVIFHLSS